MKPRFEPTVDEKGTLERRPGGTLHTHDNDSCHEVAFCIGLGVFLPAFKPSKIKKVKSSLRSDQKAELEAEIGTGSTLS